MATPRRVYFLVAVKAVGDLSNLPEGFVYLADPPNRNGPTIRKTSLPYSESDFLVRWLGSKTIGGSTWLLVLVMPVSQSWEWGCRAQRYLRRVALNNPTRLRGPWSLRQFAALYPAVAATIPTANIEVLAGDDIMARELGDYRPSDQDATNDTEPTAASVFAES